MINENEIYRAALIIKKGGLVAFPTETVYGLGADAFNPAAVARIFEVKKRPKFDPLIVHISRTEELDSVVQKPSGLINSLIDVFWPGPLTLVLPKKADLPDIVTSGLSSVGVRMPDHPVALKLIEMAETPIAAPSANPFGRISPTSAAHVKKYLGSSVDMIIDYGSCSVGVESTILSLVDEKRPVLLRPGGIPVEEIIRITGPVYPPDMMIADVLAPGMLPRHYSPRTPVRMLEDYFYKPNDSKKLKIGLLSLKKPMESSRYHAVEVLSESGDLAEAASNLFAALHRLDCAGLDIILAEHMPETGMGATIADRIRRAVHE